MVLNWGCSRTNFVNAIPLSNGVLGLVWPGGAAVFADRVTQQGIIAAQATGQAYLTQFGIQAAQAGGENFLTQMGVAAAQAVGEVFLTQQGILAAQATGEIRVTQVGAILVTTPSPTPPCVGEVEGQRTDGLPYTPADPAPCVGSGTISGQRTGD